MLRICFVSLRKQVLIRSSFLSLSSTWTVRDTIKKLKNKFPGDTTNYYLFLKDKIWNQYTLLEDDKPLSTYKQLEDPKVGEGLLTESEREGDGEKRESEG